MAYILHILTHDDLFVDVGINVGSYTILASAVKRARVFCFEPIGSTYQKLLDNIKLNELSERVAPFNIGISNRTVSLLFTYNEKYNES